MNATKLMYELKYCVIIPPNLSFFGQNMASFQIRPSNRYDRYPVLLKL